MKLGVIALGSLVWATPLCAQSASDPLAPLPPNTPQQSAPQQLSTPAVDQAPTVETRPNLAPGFSFFASVTYRPITF